MLSFEQCKKILNSEEKQYSDTEVTTIKDLLNRLAKADLELFRQMQYENRKKSNHLFKGINDRPS